LVVVEVLLELEGVLYLQEVEVQEVIVHQVLDLVHLEVVLFQSQKIRSIL
jgi:hypothetical protein